MKIAYLVNTHPRGSTTFIRREIQALERMGWQVHRIAMRADEAPLVDPADIAERERTDEIPFRRPVADKPPIVRPNDVLVLGTSWRLAFD